MSLMHAYTQLRTMIDEAEDDVKKADGGNKAAGTRVRKKMQEVKNHAQEVRKLVLETKGSEAPAGAPSA